MGGMSLRYIAIAAPNQIECVPISFDEKPSVFSLMMSAAIFNSFSISLFFMFDGLLSLMYVFTGESWSVPLYESICVIVFAHVCTGHSSLLPDFGNVIVSFLESFF